MNPNAFTIERRSPEQNPDVSSVMAPSEVGGVVWRAHVACSVCPLFNDGSLKSVPDVWVVASGDYQRIWKETFLV
jgi:hypothetical protein